MLPVLTSKRLFARVAVLASLAFGTSVASVRAQDDAPTPAPAATVPATPVTASLAHSAGGATITITLPTAVLAQAAPREEPDPTLPFAHVGTIPVAFSDDKNNTGTALMMVTAVRDRSKDGKKVVGYHLDVKYFRMSGAGKLEEFERETLAPDLVAGEMQALPADDNGADVDSATDAQTPGATPWAGGRTRGKYNFVYRKRSAFALRSALGQGQKWITTASSYDAESDRDRAVRLLGNNSSTPSTSVRELPPVNTGGDVHVNGYYRKDGTYVRPHTRSRPGGGRSRK
jgi:hypothetical protein